jgi:hypothetical protein
MLNGSGQNGIAVGCSALRSRSTRTLKTAGVLAGTNPPVSSMRNTVNPTFRFREEAGALARAADGIAGRGCRSKRMPVCNGLDRRCVIHGNITPPRKRAHFRQVVDDERDCRTALGRNSK